MKHLLPKTLKYLWGDYLVGCLAQVFVEVEMVDCMASHVDFFGPKISGVFYSSKMVLATSINILFFLSTIPFC
jgi:hypothetical protein